MYTTQPLASPDWMRESKRLRVLYTITRRSADACRRPDRCGLRAISEGTLSPIDREVPRRWRRPAAMEVSRSPSVYVRHPGIVPWRPGLGRDRCDDEPRLWVVVMRTQLRLAASDLGGSLQDICQIDRETKICVVLQRKSITPELVVYRVN